MRPLRSRSLGVTLWPVPRCLQVPALWLRPDLLGAVGPPVGLLCWRQGLWEDRTQAFLGHLLNQIPPTLSFLPAQSLELSVCQSGQWRARCLRYMCPQAPYSSPARITLRDFVSKMRSWVPSETSVFASCGNRRRQTLRLEIRSLLPVPCGLSLGPEDKEPGVCEITLPCSEAWV